jgi:predicted Zn-dependent protease
VIRILTVIPFLSLCFFAGCSNPALSDLGASVLSSTGYVSSDQAKGLFTAGEKLVKSQEELTPEQEYYLGRAVSAQVLERYTPVLPTGKTSYINLVGQTLAGVSDMPETFGGYHFAVIQSEEINAVSAPGGFVYISSALIKQLSDEDELAAVLAHEIAHVVKRHGVNAISNASLFSALTDVSKQAASVAASRVSSPVDLGPITSVFAESVSGVTEKLLTKGYDRSQEYEADLYAAQLLQRAGYDPNALDRVLTILEGSSINKQGGWFDTHPSPADRIEELKDDFTFPTSQAPNSIRKARFKKTMG